MTGYYTNMLVDTPDHEKTPQQAQSCLRGQVLTTPVLRADSLDQLAGCQIAFKCEHLQKTGSFKFRGASLAVSRLNDDCAGVATHSSGNHGAALAAAATARGLPAHVVMPDNAVLTKVESVKAHGGYVHFCQPTQQAREQGLANLVSDGFVPIPPYDHDDIILGQGTVAVEFLDQVQDLDTIVAPIGGGGLLAGLAMAAAEHARPVRIVGAEPIGADDAARSLNSGQRTSRHEPDTIADGLRALIGQRNFSILNQYAVDILTVTDAEILSAMNHLWRTLKQVIEPSGAVALAAVLKHAEQFSGQRVGVILSGGNLDLEPMFALLQPQCAAR